MIINKNEEIKIQGQFTRVFVSCGELVLGISPKDGTMSLLFISEKGLIHLLCDHFKRLGNINKYARCYGVEFIK